MGAPFVPSSVLTGQPFRVTLGLRRLDPTTWRDLGPDRSRQVAEKRRLLAERPGDVVRWEPSSDVAAAELLATVVSHLATHAPELDRQAVSGVHPVDAAGRLVCEDLCVLQRSDASGT